LDTQADDDPEDDDDDETTPNKKAPTDVVGKARSLVIAIRISTKRQESFYQVVTSGNTAGWWKDETGTQITIQPLMFLRDVRTRWDSTHQMLIRFLMFKQVSVIVFASFISI
jgi:hypothetical protein